MSAVFGEDVAALVKYRETSLTFANLLSGNLSRFGELLDESGVPRGSLRGTVFAFTNRGYEDLLESLGDSAGDGRVTPAQKRQLLKYHLVGETLSFQKVTGGGETQPDTAHGSPLSIGVERDQLVVRDACGSGHKVSEVVHTSDGVIVYVIPSVLRPTELGLKCHRSSSL
jgi:hypothetical protein